MVSDCNIQKCGPRWLTILGLISLMGCQSAFLTLPGGRLTGDEVQVESFSFAADYGLLQLEVRPDKPYSVWLRVIVKNEKLYIDAAPNRRWHKYLADDPRVRVKLGDKIYPARVQLVTDKILLQEFLSNRSIYRLDPAQVTSDQGL